MKITNRHGLPEALVRAVQNDDYEPAGDISVTQLIDPPQKVELIRGHWDEIEEDAADRVWALLGSAVHHVLDRADTPDSLHEERLLINLDGWTISGKPDLYEGNGMLSDWKVTSVWAFMFGAKREWVQQLNLYAALYRAHGFEVKSLQIVAILRDWQRRSADDNGYPQAPALRQPVTLWSAESALRFLNERVALHRRAREGGDWEPCTDEERWARGDQWAVIKKGQKRSIANFGADTKRGGGKPEAVLFAEEMQRKGLKVTLEHRPGANVRCESYCQAAPFCEQWKAIQAAQAATTSDVKEEAVV